MSSSIRESTLLVSLTTPRRQRAQWKALGPTASYLAQFYEGWAKSVEECIQDNALPSLPSAAPCTLRKLMALWHHAIDVATRRVKQRPHNFVRTAGFRGKFKSSVFLPSFLSWHHPFLLALRLASPLYCSYSHDRLTDRIDPEWQTHHAQRLDLHRLSPAPRQRCHLFWRKKN